MLPINTTITDSVFSYSSSELSSVQMVASSSNLLSTDPNKFSCEKCVDTNRYIIEKTVISEYEFSYSKSIRKSNTLQQTQFSIVFQKDDYMDSLISNMLDENKSGQYNHHNDERNQDDVGNNEIWDIKTSSNNELEPINPLSASLSSRLHDLATSLLQQGLLPQAQHLYNVEIALLSEGSDHDEWSLCNKEALLARAWNSLGST